MDNDNDMQYSDSSTLARIDERTSAQTVAFALHVKDDGERFDKVFDFISKKFDKIDGRFDKIDERLSPLQDESNRRKGAISASKMISSAFYALMAITAGYFGGSHTK